MKLGEVFFFFFHDMNGDVRWVGILWPWWCFYIIVMLCFCESILLTIHAVILKKWAPGLVQTSCNRRQKWAAPPETLEALFRVVDKSLEFLVDFFQWSFWEFVQIEWNAVRSNSSVRVYSFYLRSRTWKTQTSATGRLKWNCESEERFPASSLCWHHLTFRETWARLFFHSVKAS